MKHSLHLKIAFILLAQLVSHLAISQYIPMVEEGKFWIYLNHIDSDHPVAVSGHAITFEGDTIIGTLSYKKVYQLSLKGEHSCQFPPCFQFDVPYVISSKVLIAFIREDIADRKVYNLPIDPYGFCDTTEHLIFDYSLITGDTVNPCLFDFISAEPEHPIPMGIVDSIDVTERFGKNRNTLFTTGVQLHAYLPIIGEVLILEGIGLELYGIFHEPLSFLVDFCEGGMEACEILVSTPAPLYKQDITIFPNPSTGMVEITGVNDLKHIRIYSMMGALQAEYFNTQTLDVSALDSGVYVVELILENDDRMIRKIIKENR